MMFIALKKKRISRPVLLEVACEVVSRPGVLFCDVNAASNDAQTSADPNVIRFDIVKTTDHFSIAENLKKFYQGEVLVPMCIPPHLIHIPDTDMLHKPICVTRDAKWRPTEKRETVAPAELEAACTERIAPQEKSPSELVPPESSFVNQTVFCEKGGSGSKMPFSTTTLLLTAAGGGSSTFSTPSALFSQTPVCFTKEDSSGQPIRIDLELGAPRVVKLAMDPVARGGVLNVKGENNDCCYLPVGDQKTIRNLISTSPQAAHSPLPVARGGVQNVKGEHNDCCYHLAGVIGTLCRDPNAVSTGRTSCSKLELASARNQILENLSRWRKAQREWCSSDAELEECTELPRRTR